MLKYTRAVLLSGAAIMPLNIVGGVALAQQATPIPEIVVSSPTPIHRPRPAASTSPGPAAAAPAPVPASTVGVLPVITDQFATVTVVPDEEIQRNGGATLGDLLMNKPGITGSGFAPGAASRPIVRGLDNNRVRIQENGLSAGGVSDLGEDHGVPVDPLAATQVEVLRGPATLRWGSQAIGGVVSATNNRIPEFIPPRGGTAEFRGSVSSVDRGFDGAVLMDAGKGNVAFHADAFGRNAQDYRIPSYPYLYPEDPPPTVGNRQPNSSARANGESIGGSYVFNDGFIGVAISQFDSLYHVPGMEAAETGTRIDMRQTKVTSKGEVRPRANGIDTIRFWLGNTDYRHFELADENGFDGVQQTFTNREQEGRVEVTLTPFDLRFASVTTAVGVQGSYQRLTAPGVEGGLFDPNQTANVAGFMFNEFKFNEAFKMQLAGRVERSTVKGSVADLFVDPDTVFDRDRSFTPKSGAIGFLHDLPWGLVGSATAQYVERAPRAAELLSRGAHEATGTFDIGNPDLEIEKAQSYEIGLRRAQGPLRFEGTFFYTRFNGFIYRHLTDSTCDGDFASCAPGDAGELRQAIYSQRDATFRGGELAAQLDVAPVLRGLWGVDAQYDMVRATFTDGTNVPRIPPQRLGGGVWYRDTNWFLRVGLLHAFAQNDFSAEETPTAGYNLLKAEISHTQQLTPSSFGPREVTLGVVGNNLLNADIRNSVSFKKDEVLMPGIGVRAFASVKF